MNKLPRINNNNISDLELRHAIRVVGKGRAREVGGVRLCCMSHKKFKI